MTVRADGAGVILLEDDCPAEDAEVLLRLLSLKPASTVDWRACEQAHTAVLQVLLAAHPVILGPPRGSFLAKWFSPAFLEPRL
jgi:hypothetical protein